jgi:hypothetical protein
VRRALDLLPQRLAVCRLPPGAPVPPWALSGPFCSVTRAPGELSLICAEDDLPARPAQGDAAGAGGTGAREEGAADAGLRVERGFRAFRVAGPLDFGETGVLAGFLEPLAQAGIPVLALSTFDTDYLLVREGRVMESRTVLGQVAEVRGGS